MSNQIQNSFVQQWSDEVKARYQLKTPKLREVCTVVNNVTGATHAFHNLGTLTAGTKARDGALTYQNATQSVVPVTLVDSYVPILIDKLDEAKSNVSFRAPFQSAAANALARETDVRIATALRATTTNITTLTGGFTMAKILEALTYFNTREVPMEDRFLVIGPFQLQEALGIVTLTSVDYMQLKAIQNAQIGEALGFKWIMSSNLVKDALNSAEAAQANTRHCMAVHKDSVGLAIGQEVQTTVGWNEERYAHSIVSTMSMGSVIIDMEGVVDIGCVDPT